MMIGTYLDEATGPWKSKQRLSRMLGPEVRNKKTPEVRNKKTPEVRNKTSDDKGTRNSSGGVTELRIALWSRIGEKQR